MRAVDAIGLRRGGRIWAALAPCLLALVCLGAPSSARAAISGLHSHVRIVRHPRPRAHAAVMGGIERTIEQLPWQVEVFVDVEFEEEELEYRCGGSIIDLSHVLIAANCTIDPFTGTPLRGGSFEVVAGVSSLTETELKSGPTVQKRAVKDAGVRVHPYFDPAALPPTPDDVAVLELETPLQASAAVRAIELPSGDSSPPEGNHALLSGFGRQNAAGQELDSKLYSLTTSITFPRRCGGEADAVFLCASSGAGGTACGSDTGGPLTEPAVEPSVLVGVLDAVEFLEEQPCHAGAYNAFADLYAPEIRDFVEGSEAPPRAPRGGGVSVAGVIVPGHLLACSSGTWSGIPSFTYVFTDTRTGTVLQHGSSPSLALTEADVGATIACEVMASNAGGTGLARTKSLPPIQPPPPPAPQPPQAPTPAPTLNVLSSSESGASRTQIEAALARVLTPRGKRARLASLRRTRAFTVEFGAPEAGTVTIDWFRVPHGAHLARTARAHPKPELIAAGHATVTGARHVSVVLRLTSAGRSLLAHARSVKLTAKATFTPAGGGPVSALKTFTLTR